MNKKNLYGSAQWLYGNALWIAAFGFSVQGGVQAQELSEKLSGTEPSSFLAQSERALYLGIGHQQTVTPDFTPARIAIGNSAIVDANILRSAAAGSGSDAQILLTGKSAGTTSLTLWPKLKGEPQQWHVQVVNGVPLVLDKRLSSIPEHAAMHALHTSSLPPGGALIDRSYIDVKSNTVQVDVQVVEFKKSAMKKAGLNFKSLGANDKGFSFGLYNPATGGSQSPFVDAMNLVLSFGKAFSGAGLAANFSLLESNGLARVLAKPTLVAHSGQSASFLAGGELPIPVSANDGNIAIEYKEFGIKLQLTPTVLANDRIALWIQPIDATHSLNISAGVLYPKVFLGRSFNFLAIASNSSCE